jgi:glyoxylase-like metal-dependent hydrolase (beta-lactamase superfamily II)
MEVHVLHALRDNFMYLIVDSASREAAVVDPADADAVVEIVNRLDVDLTTVLTTHHHPDHAGGNQRMAKLFPGITIVGGKIDAVQVRRSRLEPRRDSRVLILPFRCPAGSESSKKVPEDARPPGVQGKT